MEPWPISVAPNWIVITSSAPILTQAFGLTASFADASGRVASELSGDISQAPITPVAPMARVTPAPWMNSRRVAGTPVRATLRFI